MRRRGARGAYTRSPTRTLVHNHTIPLLHPPLRSAIIGGLSPKSLHARRTRGAKLTGDKQS